MRNTLSLNNKHLSGLVRMASLLLASLSLITTAGAATYFVDDDSNAPSPDGTSWATAYPSIQQAVDAAGDNGASETDPAQVWVAEGTYTGTGNNVVVMSEYVSLYGGFAGTETEAGQRDFQANETIIDGEETRRGVYCADAILDGFIITRGDAYHGGGACAKKSSPIIANCTFKNNRADLGGGFSCESTASTLISCQFISNSADYIGGGLAVCWDAQATVINCAFLTNDAKDVGGGIYVSDHNKLTLTNSTIANNTNGGIYTEEDLTVTNCILWDNDFEIYTIFDAQVNVSYSCVKNGFEGEGNISENPLFWNVLENDFRLHPASPCIDSSSQTGPLLDIRGVERPVGSGVDMGAIEVNEQDTDSDGLFDDFEVEYSDTNPSLADSNLNGRSDGEEWFEYKTWYVDSDSTALFPTGTSWPGAFPDIQTAIDIASIQGGGDVWVASGSYTSTDSTIVVMRENVHLYGGFTGNEAQPDERDSYDSPSIIGGEESRLGVLGRDNATLDGFVITRCYSEDDSAGMLINYCAPIISNCVFKYNLGYGILNSDGSPSITNCVVSYNQTGGVGSKYPQTGYSLSSITNCTITDNSGVGLDSSYQQMNVINSIIWGNDIEIKGSPTITYSCIDGEYPDVGNLNAPPKFWNGPVGDYRLHTDSPCLNSGLTSDAPEYDIRGVARPSGQGVDIGAFEMNELDTDGDLLYDDFENKYSLTNASLADTDDDGFSDYYNWFEFQRWYVNVATQAQNPDGTSWETAFPDIQSAIDMANFHGRGEVWVAQGVYHSLDKNVIVMRHGTNVYGGFAGDEAMFNDRQWEINQSVIDGEGQRRGVIGAHFAYLDGFIVTNGNAFEGAGMLNWEVSPAITNCRFTNNTGGYGGGMYCRGFFGVVSNCLFEKKTIKYSGGGGIYLSNSTASILNSSFIENITGSYGGGIYSGSSNITNPANIILASRWLYIYL